MAFRYDNVNDTMQQLDSSVLMTDKGIPVHVRYDHNWYYTVMDLNTGDKVVMDIRGVGLIFEALKLGYINNGNKMSYLIRDPKRMWKQGLTYDNVRTVKGRLKDGMLRSRALSDCLMNKYPSIKKAYSNASKRALSTAFHRDFAFTCEAFPTIAIEYKGHPIGSVDKDLDFAIDNRFHYLNEVLQEIVNEKG